MSSDYGNDRIALLLNYLRECLPLEGDVVECGVAAGGTAKRIAMEMAQTNKKLYLFDSFEGMPEVRTIDKGFHKGDISCPIEDVRKKLDGHNNIVFVKGFIEDTLPAQPERKYCFVHIDVDLFMSTKIALEYFYPRLVPGGMIVNDDYGAIVGARVAVDKFVTANGLQRKKLHTGQALIKNGPF